MTDSGVNERAEIRDIRTFARRGRWTVFRNIAAAVGMNLIFLSAYALLISLIIVSKMDDGFTAAAITVSIAGEAVWLCRITVENSRAYRSFINELYSMPDEDFESMCVQVKECEPLFKTLYVFERYLYVPDCVLLLPLDRVKKLKSRIRSGFYSIEFAYLIVYHGRKKTRVKIKDKKEFKLDHRMFIKAVCDRCGNVGAEKNYR